TPRPRRAVGFVEQHDPPVERAQRALDQAPMRTPDRLVHERGVHPPQGRIRLRHRAEGATAGATSDPHRLAHTPARRERADEGADAADERDERGVTRVTPAERVADDGGEPRDELAPVEEARGHRRRAVAPSAASVSTSASQPSTPVAVRRPRSPMAASVAGAVGKTSQRPMSMTLSRWTKAGGEKPSRFVTTTARQLMAALTVVLLARTPRSKNAAKNVLVSKEL